jgi:hypothetical protein
VHFWSLENQLAVILVQILQPIRGQAELDISRFLVQNARRFYSKNTRSRPCDLGRILCSVD